MHHDNEPEPSKDLRVVVGQAFHGLLEGFMEGALEIVVAFVQPIVPPIFFGSRAPW